MNKDLIIGILISVVLHTTFLFGFNRKAPPVHKAVEKKEAVIQFEMPPLDEEKPDKVEDLADEQPQNVMAPPSLVDVPSVVPVNAFVQPLTPPPPPGLTPSTGVVTIPVIKPGANFGRGIKDLFDINNLDQRPVPRVQSPPQYPYEMSRAGISGEVVVEFIINTNGDVMQTQVVRSSHREFEAPAQQAVSKWKFKPGRKGGRTVNVRAQQLLEFNLDDAK
jgi:protein TonB